MDISLSMDNDSGYVSHNQESNLDYSSENVYKFSSTVAHSFCLNEDTLLEQPVMRNNVLNKSGTFDSVINDSQESVKTEFSGFEDSDNSDVSVIIPPVKPIIWNQSDLITTNENANIENNYGTNCKSSSKKARLTPVKLSRTPHKVLANVTNTYDQNVNKNYYNEEDKENIHPSNTPKKRFENRLNVSFSPDLFSDEDESTKVEQPQKRKSPSVRAEDNINNDMKLLKRVQTSLSGVHPPPSVTILQMTVHEMLNKLQTNKELMWEKNNSSVSFNQSQSLLICSEPESVDRKWPEILTSRYHGLHFNRNRVSEEFEHLCSKYAERYIGAETQSTCTVFGSNPGSSQKRRFSKPRWVAKSPGRRLSHLARRRITFSSANLQASNSAAILGSRSRQLLVDAKKLSLLIRKSPKKSPRKTPSKSPFKARKNTPTSSAKKKLALRFREMAEEFEASTSSTSSCSSMRGLKRSLFTSPAKDRSFSGSSMEKRSTKRALFVSPYKKSPQNSPHKALERKRKRTEGEDENPPRLSRSFSLDLPRTEFKPSANRTMSEIHIRPDSSELSEQHKKKLQWAVYESLRLQNITSAHPQYKIFASVLARVIRRFLPNLKLEGTTTEKMFRLARYHSYAVVKGRTVDEIVSDYMKNKLKNQKPQGYVTEANERPKDFANKENILQEKINIIESIEKRRSVSGTKSRFLSQNRIDKIKKVISFEEDSKLRFHSN